MTGRVKNICVITKTIFKNKISRSALDNDINIHHILRNASKKYIGCKFSENFQKSDDSFINISLWDSEEMWNNWKNSSDRCYIQKSYQTEIDEDFKIFVNNQ